MLVPGSDADDLWSAVLTDYNLAAQGRTMDRALWCLIHTVEGQMALDRESGIEPLSMLRLAEDDDLIPRCGIRIRLEVPVPA